MSANIAEMAKVPVGFYRLERLPPDPDLQPIAERQPLGDAVFIAESLPRDNRQIFGQADWTPGYRQARRLRRQIAAFEDNTVG